MRHLGLLLPVLAGCTDVPEPFDLDHARIMAVRIEPPSLEANATATIDVLVTDSSVMPRVADPDAVTVRLSAEAAAFARYLARTPQGWQLTAPDAATLAENRVAAGLAPDAAVPVPLELEVLTLDGPLAASKLVLLGPAAINPPTPTILVDGIAGELAMRAGTESLLTVEQPDATYRYRWFSSAGDLVGFTRAEATIKPAEVEQGLIGVVVRDSAGGTAWSLSTITVAR